MTASDDATARVWDVPTRTSADSRIIAEGAEALSGYVVNDSNSLIRLDDAADRTASLRQRVAHAEPAEPSATGILHWFFEEPWERTISPLSGITVSEYIVERLKQCTDDARAEDESHFLGHPLLLKFEEFCPGTAAPGADSAAPVSRQSKH